MASFNIHLAIGKRYLEKNKLGIDEKKFYRGIVDPDLVPNKKISHYTSFNDKMYLLEYLSHKVELKNYLDNEYDASDYQKGIFLHLITDYLFFNNFFDCEYLKNVDYFEFCRDLYYSYSLINEYLDNKYGINYKDFGSELEDNIALNKQSKKADSQIGKNILPVEKVDAFIEYVSDIDLEKYSCKIIENGGNVFPD